MINNTNINELHQTIKTSSIRRRRTLPNASRRISTTTLQFQRLRHTFRNIIRRVNGGNMRITNLGGTRATTIHRHIRLSTTKLTRRTLFHRRRIRRLVTNISTNIMRLDNLFNLISINFRLQIYQNIQRLTRHNSLGLRLITTLISSLSILPHRLMLLPLTLVRGIRNIRLLLRNQRLRRLNLRMRRNRRMGLPSGRHRSRATVRRRRLPTTRRHDLRRRRSSSRGNTNRLTQTSIVHSFVERLPKRNNTSGGVGRYADNRLYRRSQRTSRIRKHSPPLRRCFRRVPTLMDNLKNRRTPCNAMRHALFICLGTNMCRRTRRGRGDSVRHRREKLRLIRTNTLNHKIRRVNRPRRQRRRPRHPRTNIEPILRQSTRHHHDDPPRRYPRSSVTYGGVRDAPPV